MSNLNNNTTQLELLLAKVNALPEAGGSDLILQGKIITPTTSKQTVTADSGYDGLHTVTVNAIPDTYIQPSGTLDVTANGTHDVKNYANVNVNVVGDTNTIYIGASAPTADIGVDGDIYIVRS